MQAGTPYLVFGTFVVATDTGSACAAWVLQVLTGVVFVHDRYKIPASTATVAGGKLHVAQLVVSSLWAVCCCALLLVACCNHCSAMCPPVVGAASLAICLHKSAAPPKG